MSNPNWPGGFPPQEGNQQPAEPSYPPQQGESQPPGQVGQPNQPPGYPPAGYPPPSYPPAPSPYAPYGQPGAPSQPLYPYGQPTTGEGQSGAFGQPGTGEPSALPSYPPYGQPAMPSQPLYPYGQPGAPSQPLYPYGQPAGPSQPLYPYGMPGQYGPPSQGFPGAPMTDAPPRKSRRGLWIGLVVALLVLGTLSGGGVFAFSQYQAPANAAAQFCDALKNANYVTAYGMFSSALQGQYQQTQFTQGAQTLDTLEGNVVACKQATGNAYSYSLFGSKATVQTVITRGKSGNMTGALHLKNEGGAWKVDGIDTTLLGVNLGALQAVTGFCAAMQGKDYTTAYSFFGAGVQVTLSAKDFQSNTQLWDQVDGPVSACSPQALGTNTDTGGNVTVSLTRVKKGAVQGNVVLDIEGGAWKFNTVDVTLLGSDLGPLQVGNQFCVDLAAGKFDAAYNLFSANFRSQVSSAKFKSAFVVPGVTIKWSCAPQLDTYKVSGDTASYDMTMKATDPATGVSAPFNLTFNFVKDIDKWEIAYFV